MSDKVAKVEALHVAYRPRTWTHVVGQDVAVKALERIVTQRKAQAFLLTGPSGTGKTTLARIAAKDWGCARQGIMEIDAVTNSGVDHVRSIQEVLRYKAMGGEGRRAIIIDECHGLSRQAWDALLKAVEEPPEHVVWFFCTTNPAKVPATIKTRCTTIGLKLVDEARLTRLAKEVASEEGMKVSSEVLSVVTREANGSPRQMLVNLELCAGARDRREASDLLQRAAESDATLELCRYLMQGNGSWTAVGKIMAKLDGENPEGVRIIVCNYFGAVLKNAKGDKQAIAALRVLENFATPYNQSEGIAPLFMSVGRTIFAG